MPNYRFRHDFDGQLTLAWSDGARRGPRHRQRYRIPAGEIVELPSHLADWIRRDRGEEILEEVEDEPTRELANLRLPDGLPYAGPATSNRSIPWPKSSSTPP